MMEGRPQAGALQIRSLYLGEMRKKTVEVLKSEALGLAPASVVPVQRQVDAKIDPSPSFDVASTRPPCARAGKTDAA
jgi:hypothetical protein